MSKLLLEIKNLNISFISNSIKTKVVNDFNLTINQNEIIGIVGESGSGKSVSTLSILGLLPKHNCEIKGSILFKDKEMIGLEEAQFQKIRGKQISMIFQEPMSSLNPSMRCGDQVFEIIKTHHPLLKNNEIKKEVLALFDKVKLPRIEAIYNSYPHQISGGQKQRVMIAMAIACKPKLIIADEPTTALDVTIQNEIVQLLKALQQETGVSILFITHDLALVSEIADRVLVMHKGSTIEKGDANQIFNAPKESYTKALIHSKPRLDIRLKKLPTVADFLDQTVLNEIITKNQRTRHLEDIYSKTPILEVVNLKTHYVGAKKIIGKQEIVKAVDGVSFKLFEKETVGLVGESGCGKTSLGRTLLGLEKLTQGEIIYKGRDISKFTTKEKHALKKDIQIIFQDPFASLNPKMTIGNALIEPMTVHNLLNSKAQRKEKVLELLEKVGLTKEHFNRYPHEFSGGQRQRIGIARAIALAPKVIICDESVSALDVSVQAQVLNLLNTLKTEFNFSFLFISHDLSVVKYMSDNLLVMKDGKIIEHGDADKIYDDPKESYTQNLIKAIPKGI